jgi:hypothetical protein
LEKKCADEYLWLFGFTQNAIHEYKAVKRRVAVVTGVCTTQCGTYWLYIYGLAMLLTTNSHHFPIQNEVLQFVMQELCGKQLREQ